MSRVEANKTIAFEIILDSTNKPKSAKPRRLQKDVNKYHLSTETLEDKLAKADKRRQDQIAARIQRIHQKDAECRKITDAVSEMMDSGTGHLYRRRSGTVKNNVLSTVQESLDKMNKISNIDDNFFNHE